MLDLALPSFLYNLRAICIVLRASSEIIIVIFYEHNL
jgi:hypothetical protein